jgi:hypothetical protein
LNNFTRLSPVKFEGSRLIHGAIAFLLVFQGWTGIATATGFSLSLNNLVQSGGKFDSTNHQLKFADFSATVSELPGADLSRFLLVPLVDGFRLQVESGAPLPMGTELVLSYTVKSKARGRNGRFGLHGRPQRRPLDSMSIGIVGTSFLDSPLSSGMEAFSGYDDAHANSLGEVQASTRAGGADFAATNLTDPNSGIRILAYLVVGVDGFLSRPGSRSDDDGHGDGYGDEGGHGEFERPGNEGVEMRFSAEPIPEPSSVLLVGFGLAVLSSWTRRRADS